MHPSEASSNILQTQQPTAGAHWFHLPRTVQDSRVAKELKLIKMRSALDPKRHFKNNAIRGGFPVYSQSGTIVEGTAEFFSGRKTRRDRKNTMMDEALASERATHQLKRKYGDVQERKKSGKQGYYKALRRSRRSNV